MAAERICSRSPSHCLSSVYSGQSDMPTRGPTMANQTVPTFAPSVAVGPAPPEAEVLQGSPPVTERVAVAFARFLRAEGLDVPMSATLSYVDALDTVGIASRDAVYWAGRATIVRRPEDIPLYDTVFDAFWMRGRYESREERAPDQVTIPTHDGADDSAARDGADSGYATTTVPCPSPISVRASSSRLSSTVWRGACLTWRTTRRRV